MKENNFWKWKYLQWDGKRKNIGHMTQVVCVIELICSSFLIESNKTRSERSKQKDQASKNLAADVILLL